MTLARSRLVEAIACAVYQQAKDRSDKPWHQLHEEARGVYLDAIQVAFKTGDMDEMTSELANILGFGRPNQSEVTR